MLKFSVPADYKLETIYRYSLLNEQYSDRCVYETYGQLTENNVYGSGRPVGLLPTLNTKSLEKYIYVSHEHNIKFNYIFNATCLGNREFQNETISKMESFFELIESLGVDYITVAIPAVIDFIKKRGYQFKLKASTLCGITNVNKAKKYMDFGAERFVVCEDINRDFNTLQQLCDTFPNCVEVIVNVICLSHCMFRPFHQNQGSHNYEHGDAGVKYYEHQCMLQRLENSANLVKMNWVRPEDLNYYCKTGINLFKIQGRHLVEQGDIVRCVEAYLNESYDGDLMFLLNCFSQTSPFNVKIDNKRLDGFIKGFYERKQICQNNCARCSYCDSFAKNAIQVEDAKHKGDIGSTYLRKVNPYSLYLEQKQ